MPHPQASTATDHAHARGRSDINNENGASSTNDHSIALAQRDGRHSMRQGAYAIDKRRDFDISGSLVAKEPAPEPIVFAVQQPSENPAFLFGSRRVFAIQPAFQQLIEFAHAAPASPAQALDLGRGVFAHAARSRPTVSTPHIVHSSRLLARNA